MYSFSATIALTDDDGHHYYCSPDDLRDYVEDNSTATIFTTARGNGYDTATGQSEPVLIIQGEAPSLRSLHDVRVALDTRAAKYNQRAIGWFVSTDSYSKVPN